MKKSSMFINTFSAFICAILINTTTFAEPTNLSLLKERVKIYHDSGAYLKELTEVITRAQAFIINRVEMNTHTGHPEKLAIVLDIDETSLSNYSNIVSREFTANREQLHQEILAANAPAIKPTLSFYNDALKNGITVFFVTGRKESERFATNKNLKYAGFHDWAGLYLKPENYQKPSIAPFKSLHPLVISTAISREGMPKKHLNYLIPTIFYPKPRQYRP